MYWVPIIAVGLILLVMELVWTRNFLRVLIITLASALLMGIIVVIDYTSQTSATEVWSGKITKWEHKEEYDEWHPPVTSCSTDGKGKQSCTTQPGYMEHHYAQNHIYTSDNGWIDVDKAPDGKKFDDNWPNDDGVLKQYWPEGTPSASTHTYVNKVQASYSIYKHKEIDLNNFKDLPEYPKQVTNYVNVNRIIGEVPNKEKALVELAKWNTELNKSVPDPNKPGKTMSWKQVNIIFVNLGVDKPQEMGFALQDKWEGGNKNDFVVTYSTDKDGNVAWTYPFSWSEVEILKIQVRDYMNELKKIDDFVPVVNKVSEMIAKDFVRKQFADFNYLQIEVSKTGYVCIFIDAFIALIIGIVLAVMQNQENQNRQSRRRRY